MKKTPGKVRGKRAGRDSAGIPDVATLGGDEAFHLFFEHHSIPMLVHEPETGRIAAVNDAAVRFYGYDRDEFLGLDIHALEASDDAGEAGRTPETSFDHERFPSTRRHVRKDGTTAWVERWSHEVELRGRRMAIVAVFDVTKRVRAEDQLSVQAAYFRQLFENSPEGIVILDDKDRIIEANKGFQAMFKYRARELKGKPINELIVPDAHQQEASGLSSCALGGDRVETETIRQTKQGELVEVAILGYPITLNGDQLGVYGIYRDITERKRLAGLMAYQAGHDSLTDLLNRQEFERRLSRLVRDREGVHSLLFLDLDQFKAVNELHGHAAGDELLRQLARLIRRQVRKSDWVARVGGDEFAVLLYGCNRARAEQLAQNLLTKVLKFRFVWGERKLPLSASIGLVEINDRVNSLSDVLTAGETAVYAAKKYGSNRIQTYDPDARDMVDLKGEISWITPINEALAEDRFVLFYQRMDPVSEGDGPHPDGYDARYELLVRMFDSDGALVLPSLFIPTAERYNLMPTVDRWVIRTAFEELARRVQPEGRGRELVSINVSGTSLNSEGFPGFVADEFQRTRIPPGCICFEITETAAITNLEQARAFIREMKRLGVSIALDDFGSGMSSFSYLKALPVDYIKIDGLFIRDMLTDPMDAAIVDAINRLAHVLGIATVAEFVERKEIFDKLKELGVDFAQGYAIHRPETWIPGQLESPNVRGR